MTTAERINVAIQSLNDRIINMVCDHYEGVWNPLHVASKREAALSGDRKARECVAIGWVSWVERENARCATL